MTAKSLLLASGVWLVLFASTCFYEQEIDAALWVMAGFWWLGLFLGGACLIGWSIARLTKDRQKVAPGVALLVPASASLFLHFVGTGWIKDARFHHFDRKRYAVIVARIQAAPLSKQKQVAGRECMIDSGPTLRIVFIEPGGILDNWTSIVYDPTGLVMKANQFKGDWSNWDDPKLTHVKKLFGGDLRWSEHLGGPWYRCGFT
jgi:hypothetical protein